MVFSKISRNSLPQRNFKENHEIYVIEEYYLFCTSQAIHDMDYNLHY